MVDARGYLLNWLFFSGWELLASTNFGLKHEVIVGSRSSDKSCNTVWIRLIVCALCLHCCCTFAFLMQETAARISRKMPNSTARLSYQDSGSQLLYKCLLYQQNENLPAQSTSVMGAYLSSFVFLFEIWKRWRRQSKPTKLQVKSRPSIQWMSYYFKGWPTVLIRILAENRMSERTKNLRTSTSATFLLRLLPAIVRVRKQ